MHLKVLGSSSGGNCGLVNVSWKWVLIDAGFSCRKIGQLLASEGLTPSDISAVLVTHEHTDHTAGLKTLADAGAKIYGTEGTALAVRAKLPWTLVQPGSVFEIFERVAVEVFSVPHDAADPVGYTICEGSQRLSWALDLGHLDAQMKAYLARADILMIESNYDEDRLEASRRPYYLKARIKGRHGHLCNDETFEYLTSTSSKAHWREIFLGHISRECNDTKALALRYANTGLDVNVVSPITAANPQGELVEA